MTLAWSLSFFSDLWELHDSIWYIAWKVRVYLFIHLCLKQHSAYKKSLCIWKGLRKLLISFLEIVERTHWGHFLVKELRKDQCIFHFSPRERSMDYLFGESREPIRGSCFRILIRIVIFLIRTFPIVSYLESFTIEKYSTWVPAIEYCSGRDSNPHGREAKGF